MSDLPPITDIRQREWHIRYVPIADIEHQTQPLLRHPSWEQSHSDEFRGLFRNLFPSVAGFCGQAHRTEHHLRESEFDVELVDFDLL
jgi:hypothetical protein